MNLASVVKECVKRDENGTGMAFVANFPSDTFFFDGHFPNNPVLPAMVQIGVTVALAAQEIGCEVRLAKVSRAVFVSACGPDENLNVSLGIETGEDEIKVTSRWMRDGERVSDLSLRLENA